MSACGAGSNHLDGEVCRLNSFFLHFAHGKMPSARILRRAPASHRLFASQGPRTGVFERKLLAASPVRDVFRHCVTQVRSVLDRQLRQSMVSDHSSRGAIWQEDTKGISASKSTDFAAWYTQAGPDKHSSRGCPSQCCCYRSSRVLK